MTVLLAFVAAQAAASAGAPLHTPLDRALTAQHININCLVENARRATGGRAAPGIAVAAARRFCRAQLRALDDVHRSWNRDHGFGNRGVSRADVRFLEDAAVAEVIAQRRGGR